MTMMMNPQNHSDFDRSQLEWADRFLEKEQLSNIERVEAFPKYATRRSLGRFLARYELFKKILPVNGSIIECGVFSGVGLLTWAKLSSMMEPYNHTRRVVGFDTFEGFPNVSEADVRTGEAHSLNVGGMAGSSIENVEEAVRIFDVNRPLSHIPKVELIKGDLMKTAVDYLNKNQHLVVSLLYLDVDIYEPTKKALEVFLPRIPKGGYICFDELNTKMFPGETIAASEVLGINKLRLERTNLDPNISFACM